MSVCVPAESGSTDPLVPGASCDADAESRGAALDAAASASHCIIAMFDEVTAWKGHAGFADPVRKLAAALVEVVPQTTTLLFAAPWHVEAAEGSDAVVCCWDGSRPVQLASLKAITS